MSKYAWVIIKDFTDFYDGQKYKVVEILGPRDNKLSSEEIQKKGEKFRLYDDDMILYYEGYLCGEDYHGFEPMDDYGEPNAGCTIIEYYKDGKWEVL